MTVANPYNSVGIVVHNNSDVLVAFAVAGLIDADVNQPIQTLCTLWFEIVKAPGNAAAYCLPVDTHVVCHGASGHVFDQPGNSKIKVSGKAASRVCPRNSRCYNTMLRAMYPMGIRFNFNEDPAEVQTAPYFPVLHRAVIARAASAAERTVIPVPCTGTGLDPEVNDTILIRVEIVGFYNGVLDIEQFLA